MVEENDEGQRVNFAKAAESRAERIAMTFDAFPGYALVRQGLADLAAHRETVPALLVLVGAPRLRQVGIDVPSTTIRNPDHRLYELLAAGDPDSAHSRYNALIRELVSFERAAECAA